MEVSATRAEIVVGLSLVKQTLRGRRFAITACSSGPRASCASWSATGLSPRWVAPDRTKFIDEFCWPNAKQLGALQAALDVYVGAAPGGPGELCTIGKVLFLLGLVKFDGLVRIDLAVEPTRACDPRRCWGRGSRCHSPRPRR